MVKPYDDLIMDHIKNVRNFRAVTDANRTATGTNPLCGDEVTLYLKIADGRIADAAFQCTCCGISMASASIVTESVKGKPTSEARIMLNEFAAMLDRRADPAENGIEPMRRAILQTVRDLPGRTVCAALPWQTLGVALEKEPA